MMLHIVEAGPVATNGYIIADDDSREAMLIDIPMESYERITGLLRTEHLTCVGIVLTHGHFDHVGDVAAVARALDVPVHIHALDLPMLQEPAASFSELDLQIEGMNTDNLLESGDVLECGRLRLRILHTPGHTRGHIVLYEMREGVLFSGDVLFNGSIGRTDLPGGDYDTLMESITKKLLTLAEDTVVYPGHGERTTIGFERAHNPFVLEHLDHY